MRMTTEQRQAQVSYVPKILRSMAEICEEMGVGEKTVKAWVQKARPSLLKATGARYGIVRRWLGFRRGEKWP